MAHEPGIKGGSNGALPPQMGAVKPGPPPIPQATLSQKVFPIEAIDETPVDLGADCGVVATCADGCEYAIKDGVSQKSDRIVPHCEWFCSQLGDAVHIPIPLHKVVKMLDGTLAFGSQWIGGVISPEAAVPWWRMVERRQIPLSDISDVLTSVFVFDQFVSNEDRHDKNFIVYYQRTKYAIQAFDYSRAWLTHGWPLPPVPLHYATNTVIQRKKFLSCWPGDYINVEAAERTLNKIRKVSKSRILRILDQQPEEWLPADNRVAILDWWGSQEMLSRIDAISTGVKNGSCL